MHKKIAFLTPSLPPKMGGVDQYTYLLAQKMRSMGHDVSIITSVGEGRELQKEWIYPIIESWKAEDVTQKIRQTEKSWSVFIFQYVPHLYGRYGINFSAARIPELLYKGLKVPVITTVHEYGGENKESFQDRLLSVLYRSQGKRVIQGSKLIVTTCAKNIEEISRLKQATPVVMIPVGSNVEHSHADDESLKLLRLKYGIGEQLVLGVFGRLSAARNFPTAIRTLHFLKRRGIASKLLMIGNVYESNPLLFDGLVSLIEEFELKDDVIVTGTLDNAQVSRHMSLLDVFLFPQCDGISTRNTSVMSALMHGLPIISYPPEKGNFTGYEMPVGKVAGQYREESFFKATYDFVQSYERSSTKCSKNKQLFESSFSWDVIASAYLDAMKSCL